jgi:hypothetical protein
LKFVPAFLFSINAKVDVKFNDFDDIADHPKAGPFMVAFEALFTKIVK